MRYFAELVALIVCLPLLLRYCKAHPEVLRGPPPSVFISWSRERRLTFVWTSIILTVLVAIPACLMSTFVLLDTETCAYVISVVGLCSSAIRFGVAAVILVVFFVAILKWSLLLARVQNFRNGPSVE
jgi:hypothetical protein